MAKVLEKLVVELQVDDTMLKEFVEELEYLRHFYAEADFGPAHEDVVKMINGAYEGEVPEGYK